MLGIRQPLRNSLIQSFIAFCPWECENLGMVCKYFHTPPIFVIIKSILLAPSSFYWHTLKKNARLHIHLGNKGYHIYIQTVFGKMNNFGLHV